MLSYRHAFHAGNHADVLKHLVLIQCLTLLQRKEKGFLAVDTHAGAGSYALTQGYAAQNQEWASGIGKLRLIALEARPAAVDAYLAFVDRFEREESGRYPGSPAIISRLLRAQDRAVCCELHPSDHEELEERHGFDTNLRIRKGDGFAELKALLPPPTRRGLVFIDPSYELASDYERLIDSLRDSLKRFAEGVYCVWYPLLERAEAKELPQRLSELGSRAALRAELRISEPAPGERGMHGSGLFILNPPWKLEEALRETLPYLSAAFGSAAAEPWVLKAEEGTLPSAAR